MISTAEQIDFIYRSLIPIKKSASESKEDLKEFFKASIKRQKIKRLTKNK